jgi:hypothetical protein
MRPALVRARRSRVGALRARRSAQRIGELEVDRLAMRRVAVREIGGEQFLPPCAQFQRVGVKAGHTIQFVGHRLGL